jgi:hypothetical protein
MKKSTLLFMIVVLMFATMAFECDNVGSIPNPGFGAVAVDRTGFISSFERALPGAVTDWEWDRDNDPGATGDRFNFVTQGGSSGQTKVDRGRAPARYFIEGVQDWGPCNGLFGFQGINRAVWNYVPCLRRPQVGFVGGTFFFTPSPIDVSQTGGWNFTVSGGSGISTEHGLPYFEMRDAWGNLAVRQQATSVDAGGTQASGPSYCLAYLGEGAYGVEIVNQTADGMGEVVGVADVFLVDNSGPPPCDPGQICQ